MSECCDAVAIAGFEEEEDQDKGCEPGEQGAARGWDSSKNAFII